MSLSQLIQALSMLPQITESIKRMDEKEKNRFIDQLGLEGEERDMAFKVITCFQQGKTLSPEEQTAAQGLFEKALQMNELDMSSLFKLDLNNITNRQG